MSIEYNGGEEKISNSQLKIDNMKNLSDFSSFGIDSKSLQKAMVDLGEDLGNYGPNGDGVDGDLGNASIKSIRNIQSKLNLPDNGVVNFTLLTFLFPKTFNLQKNGRSIEETIAYVKEKVIGEKNEVKTISTSDRLSLMGDIKKVNSNKIENNNKNKSSDSGIGKFVTSFPAEVKGGMTYCSRTACKNLYNLGLTYDEVPRGPSAIASMNLYGDKNNYVNNITELPEGSNILDLFIDSNSPYEHRAAAYLNNGEWYVLDPYSKLPSNKTDRKYPIPLNEYTASKKVMGAFPHKV